MFTPGRVYFSRHIPVVWVASTGAKGKYITDIADLTDDYDFRVIETKINVCSRAGTHIHVQEYMHKPISARAYRNVKLESAFA